MVMALMTRYSPGPALVKTACFLSGLSMDSLIGGDGRDRVVYAGVTDSVFVDLASPTLNAGAAYGDDMVSIEEVVGGSGDDSIYGDDLDNYLGGSDGNDLLAGRVGDDTLEGGFGSDTLEGGTGNDTALLSQSLDGDLDLIDGGDGTDTFDVSDFGAAVWIELGYNGIEAWTLDTEDINDTSGTWRTIADLNNIENLIGTAYHDWLKGDVGNNLLEGGAGNDTLMGGTGAGHNVRRNWH